MTSSHTTTPNGNSAFYRALWRWHFYAGLLVIPFLLALAGSGLLMLLSKPVDGLLQQELTQVSVDGEALPASALLSSVQEAFPQAHVKLYVPPADATHSAQFSLVSHHAGGHGGGHGAPSITAFVNPYTGEVLGTLDPSTTIYSAIKTFHGKLYLGDLGDSLIEITAGLAILMVLSGIYLALQRNGWRELIPPTSLSSRNDWRRLHSSLGLLIAVPLVFFLLSGLSWTNVWGGKMVQAWSSVPGTSFVAPAAEETHESMNHEGMHHVPWALEQTPMPQSGTATNMPTELNLDQVSRIATEQGFENFRVHLPADENSVWTITATTMAGDVTNPTQERTLHLDRHTGEALADIRFADYPLMGKAMTAGIPLHQGDLGLWNLLVNLLFCGLIMLMIVGGITMWWKRRPQKTRALAPPAAQPSANKAVVVLMLVAALLFPLSAATIAVIIAVDLLLISRVEKLRLIFK
jgi:uncharacterized iron-regulated membrane protein